MFGIIWSSFTWQVSYLSKWKMFLNKIYSNEILITFYHQELQKSKFNISCISHTHKKNWVNCDFLKDPKHCYFLKKYIYIYELNIILTLFWKIALFFSLKNGVLHLESWRIVIIFANLIANLIISNKYFWRRCNISADNYIS